MVYPNITLKITEGLPSIELHNENQPVRPMFISDMDLQTYMASVADAINWTAGNEVATASNGDQYMIDFENVDLADESTSLSDILQVVRRSASEYEQMAGLNQEVADELMQNWQTDMLASALEGAYNLLIAKVILMADTLGIEDIRLDDDRLDPRLREKMSSELAKFNTQLLID
jgi:hypothetical protein